MANTYKNIVITPNIGNTSDPKIQFSGGNTTTNTDINLFVYPNSNGTVSFEGSAGQLFSITNDLSNSLFAVSDVSGIPSLEVFANGLVSAIPFGGNVVFGNSTTSVLVNSTAFVGNIVGTHTGAVVLGTSSLSANGGLGTAGQVLHSNGTATYWAADDNAGGTVTSVASGNGITGGTITGSGTLYAVAGVGAVVNASGVNVLAGTGIVSNATGTHVNATYIATISANNASFLGGAAAVTIAESLRANRNITGGGTITVDASYNVLWNARFIVISNGRGTHFSTAGYYDIQCPTSGTITGVGGAANRTATAAGIPLGAWESLYYILPIGSDQTSLAANFRVSSYTTDVEIPSNWVLICARNADGTHAVSFPNGINLLPGQSYNTTIFSSSVVPAANTSTLLNGKTEGNLNVNNATTAYGKTEGNLNVNNATTAYGKTEGNLNVNNATQLATTRTINGVNFNGTANILVPSLYDANYRRITNPGGAEYVTATATITGAIQVTLPVGATNTMIRMTIKVYEYATNESFEIHCGGYAYNVGNTWANNPFAYIIGNPSIDRRYTVRFGYTAGGKMCVYIGELASTWDYPQVFVTDVQLGYGGQAASYTTGWAISFQASAFENVTATITSSQVGYATSTSTASAVVLRDGSGNFTAGTITANLTGTASNASLLNNKSEGNLNVNAAAQLVTTRSINGVNFNGTANILVPSLYDANYRRFTNPGGGEYVTATATITGAIEIVFPNTFSYGMYRMTIQIYEYVTNQSFTVVAAGHTSGTSWYNTSAYIIGNPSIDRRFTVRFGRTAANKAVVYIGELASTWSYPQVFLTEFQCGYSSFENNSTGWAISFNTTAFENVSQSITNSQVGYAVSTNTINSVVLRDGSSNFSAGTITATLSGTASNASLLNNKSEGNLNVNNALYVRAPDGDRDPNTKLPTTSPNTVRFDFVGASAANTGGNYAGVMTYAPWTGTTASTGDASYQLAFGGTAVNGGGIPKLNIRKGIDSTWNSWYTLLHSGNYNDYSPTLTGTGASGTWGISITGTATSASQIDGVDFVNGNGTLNGIAGPDNLTNNGITYVSGISLLGQGDGALYSQAYSTSWVHQIYGDYRTGQIAVRGKNAGTWQAWRTILDSTNYTSYSPSLTGSGASGTWNINVNATTVNAASHTVGASLVANASGVYSTGTVNAAVVTSTNAGFTRVTNILQAAGDLRINLGTPSVEENALFHGQMNNKFRFIAPTSQEESTDNITWTASTRATAVELGDLMIGEGQATGINIIPAGTVGTADYYRLTWDVVGTTGYVYLNHLYLYLTTQGNSVTVTIEAYNNTSLAWENFGSGSGAAWPGHFTLKHNTIGYSNSAAQYSKVRVTFAVPSRGSVNTVILGAVEWFGGYPAGRRNVESYDRLKNVTFPANVTGTNFTATGSLVVGSAGTYVAGSLYSDTNWGMIFRAKQASPASAEFMWVNSAGTELFRFNGTALTTSVTGSAGAVAWSGITSKPTTVSGFGITDALSNTANKTISGGFNVVSASVGSASFTVTPLSGNYQYFTNNGAATITAPATDCAVDLLIINGSTPGGITFSGFQVGATGGSLNTTAGHEFIVSIRRIAGYSTYSIYAMQ